MSPFGESLRAGEVTVDYDEAWHWILATAAAVDVLPKHHYFLLKALLEKHVRTFEKAS